jgi:hypothetical protein
VIEHGRHGPDNGNSDQGRDQTVFNGRGAALIKPELSE